MNAAEISDKLGLHSLRQRAWVRLRFIFFFITKQKSKANFCSTSNLLVPHPVMVSMRVLSGSATPFGRQATLRLGFNNNLWHLDLLCKSDLRKTENFHHRTSPNRPGAILQTLSYLFKCLTSMRGAMEF